MVIESLLRPAALAFAALLLAPSAAAAAQGPVVHAVLAPDSELEEGEYLWEPQRAPSGRIEIVADIATDRLYVYRAGVEIGRTILIYGADEKPTPTGSFKILEKDVDHVSNIYGAPMPYMLRLTWTGIALHGSGETVTNEYATHGCIGMPDEFAALVFAVARLGDRVTVTRNWMRDIYG
jgi:hypothetical protein